MVSHTLVMGNSLGYGNSFAGKISYTLLACVKLVPRYFVGQ